MPEQLSGSNTPREEITAEGVDSRIDGDLEAFVAGFVFIAPTLTVDTGEAGELDTGVCGGGEVVVVVDDPDEPVDDPDEPVLVDGGNVVVVTTGAIGVA